MLRALYILIVVVLLGLLVWTNFPTSPVQEIGRDTSEVEKKFPLLSKRVLQELPNDYLIRFSPLRSELRELVAPWGSKFAFYFEYLPTGVSIGVNEKEEFSAASLLKVPVVMAYYLQQEAEHIEGDSYVTLTKEMIHKDYGSLWKRGVGAKVSIDEAIRLALEESDNTAIEAIISQTDYKYFQTVHDGLDIEQKEIREVPIITVKNYSSILKALFFSSIVSREHSQKILNYMANSIYTDKLPAGVSDGVPVAHKIGEAGDELFTDCGIVYIPRRAYLLCMLSVSNNETARSRMMALSKKVYTYIENLPK